MRTPAALVVLGITVATLTVPEAGPATAATARPATAATATADPATATASATADPAEDQPLQAAGKAAEQLSFVGVISVRWTENGVERRERLLVEAAGGSVVVKGGTSVMASSEQRLVEHAGGEWDLLWPGAQRTSGRPAAGLKYEMASKPGPVVSNRASKVVEARRGGVLVERMYLDAETSLLLRREQFENGQGPVRTVEFETVTIGAAASSREFPFPPKVENVSPKVMAASHVPAGMSAPAALADGYQRVGLYKRSNVVHAVYSDGLYDLSLFEQRGRLDAGQVPHGSRMTVRDRNGWRYGWAGGHVLLWHEGGTVYTAVSDAPLDQLLVAVRSLPAVTGSVSLLRRLRQVCRALVQPLAA